MNRLIYYRCNKAVKSIGSDRAVKYFVWFGTHLKDISVSGIKEKLFRQWM